MVPILMQRLILTDKKQMPAKAGMVDSNMFMS